jgi:hypothetical protein
MGPGHRKHLVGVSYPKQSLDHLRTVLIDRKTGVPLLFARKGPWTLYSVTTTRFLADDSETADDECRFARRCSAFLFLSTQGKTGAP